MPLLTGSMINVDSVVSLRGTACPQKQSLTVLYAKESRTYQNFMILLKHIFGYPVRTDWIRLLHQ